MGSNVEGLTRNLLWFLKKDKDVSKSKNNSVNASLNTVSSVGFLDKTADGVKTVANLDGALASSNAQAVTAAFDSSVFNSVKSSVKNVTGTCADLTNTCMYAVSAHNVISDKDSRTKAGVEEGSSLLGMHATESAVKSSNISEAIAKLPIPERFAIVKPVIAGAVFVAASLTGSLGGRKIGKIATGRN